MFRLTGIIRLVAGGLSAFLMVLSGHCIFACLHNEAGMMEHGWLWRVTGFPCDIGTLILILALSMTCLSIALFASLGRFATRP